MATPPRPTSPPNGAERRRFRRFNMALDVGFGPVAAGGAAPPDARLEQTVTVNISLGGLCLYSDILYPVGSQIFCSVALPECAESLRVVGTVAWFQKVDEDSHAYKLGVEFGELSEQQRAFLQALLDRPPAAAEAAQAKRVLLVDDDEELRQALKLRFESAGFQVSTTGDGLEALRRGRQEHPHLIILDLMLPGLSGFEVCRLLKFDPKFRHIPILLFSARSRREDMETGRTVGADAYVTKPFSGTELIAKVHELLEGAR